MLFDVQHSPKDLEFNESDLYEDFNAADVDLNIENYDELFGMSQSHSEHLFENGGMDSLFGMKDMSAADSNRQVYLPLVSRVRL